MKLNFKAALANQSVGLPSLGSRHAILLVDDELANLQGMTRFLQTHYDVYAYQSALLALKALDQELSQIPISIVISDHIMPEMTGLAFLSELKRRHHIAPRILLTGYAALDNIIRAVNEAAIFRYLPKPVETESLLQTIREGIHLIEVKREHQRLLALVKALLEQNAQLQRKLPSEQYESWSDKSIFPPIRQDLVVLFLDVRGFTKASRGVPPEKIIPALDRLFQPLHKVIYEAGGVVDKHLGDGLMAIFGLTGQPSARAALEGAQAIAEKILEIVPQLDPPFDQLQVGIGLASGSVVLGMIGSVYRSELAIIGETANFASRLQEYSKQLGIDLSKKQDSPRVLAICSDNLLGLNPSFESLTLPAESRIRDFPEVQTIGFFALPLRKSA